MPPLPAPLATWPRPQADKLLSPAQGRRMAARIKTANLRKLERLGHVPMSEDPGLISEIILRFTRNVAGV